MEAEDWFDSYARIEGVVDVLQRMSRRARRPNPLAGGEAEFLVDAEGFRADFLEWLADARDFAMRWR
jgi:acyl carrier protein phosphodiesterase